MSFLAPRTRRRLLWVGGIATGIYALAKYAHYKFVENEQQRELDRTAKANAKRRFEQNQLDCSYTILSLLPTLSENIFSKLNVEAITSTLQQVRHGDIANRSDENSKKRKLELWEELKIMSFTRTISAVYVVTLLSIFTYVQLNLLGRFIYLDSIESFSQRGREQIISGKTSSSARKGLSRETERRYLTFSWFLLNKGWLDLENKVENAVKEVIGSISLREEMPYPTVVSLIEKIRKKVDIDEKNLKSFNDMSIYLLPPEGKENELLRESGILNNEDEPVIDSELKRLLDETRDFLESPDFRKVFSSCLNSAFELTFKSLQNQLPAPPAEKITEIDDSQKVPGKKLAEILPIVSRIAHAIINGIPNEYVERLSTQAELKAFSVVVYTSWEE